MAFSAFLLPGRRPCRLASLSLQSYRNFKVESPGSVLPLPLCQIIHRLLLCFLLFVASRRCHVAPSPIGDHKWKLFPFWLLHLGDSIFHIAAALQPSSPFVVALPQTPGIFSMPSVFSFTLLPFTFLSNSGHLLVHHSVLHRLLCAPFYDSSTVGLMLLCAPFYDSSTVGLTSRSTDPLGYYGLYFPVPPIVSFLRRLCLVLLLSALAAGSRRSPDDVLIPTISSHRLCGYAISLPFAEQTLVAPPFFCKQ